MVGFDALVYKDDSLIHKTEFQKGEVIKGGRIDVELYALKKELTNE